MLRHGAKVRPVKPLNRIPILCTASILYLFIIGRNLSTKQTLAAAHHAGRGGVDRCCHGMPSGYNGPRPLHWPLLALHMLACAHPGMQRTGDAVTSILPAGIRLGHESASLLRAVEGGPQGNPTPGRRRVLSLSAMELYSVQMASEGRYRS